MKIYVATSWRNEFQPEVVAALRTAGHEVYDFRAEDGFHWSEIDPNWKAWLPSEYLWGLTQPRAEQGFKRDMDALQWCEACVYVMPCGPSASMEMGYAKGAGKPVLVYVPRLREPDLMVKMADHITNDFSEIIDLLAFKFVRERPTKRGQ